MSDHADRDRALRLLASIAASYTRRELDRRVYDRLMASRLGRTAEGLSREQKYALEFVAYAASAMAMNRLDNPGPLGQYVREVLTDIPSEFSRRMINGVHAGQFSREDLVSVVGEMSDQDIEDIVAAVPSLPASQVTKRSSPDPAEAATSPVAQAVRDATLAVERIRDELKRRRK